MDGAHPHDEAQRLAVLRSLDILDTKPESAFDLLALAAHKVAGTEMAAVSLVDESRQWFKARFGLEGDQTPRAWAFCAHTILGTDILCVEDTTLDERFRENPLVIAGPKIRSYAGVPIRVEGHNVGAVCALSAEPRQFSERVRDQLIFVASAAAEQLSMRKALATKNAGSPVGQPLPLILKYKDAHERLKERTSPELIEKGLVHVISLESIRSQMADRWPRRRESVWSYAELLVERELMEDDYLVQLDDVHGLIGQPHSTPTVAQARAVEVLSNVLKHYLGSEAPTQVRVDRVTDLKSDSVTTEPAGVSTSTADEDAGPESHEGEDQVAPHARRATGVARGGDPINLSEHARWWIEGPQQVACTIEPVWTVQTRAIVSYRVRTTLIGSNCNPCSKGKEYLTLSNLIGRDEIVLREACRLLADSGGPLVLHVPLHHATLNSVTGRRIVTAALSSLGPTASSSIIVSIVGLGIAAPQSRIAALLGVLRGSCRGVVVQAPSLDAAVERWRCSDLLGVAIDLSSVQVAPRELIAELPRFAVRARQATKGIIAYSVPSRSVMLSAWGAGFTHIGGSVLQGPAPETLEPRLMEPVQFWKAG